MMLDILIWLLWAILAVVVAFLLLVAFRVTRAFVRYHQLKGNYAHLPRIPITFPQLVTHIPGSLACEKFTSSYPVDANGHIAPLIFQGPHFDGSPNILVADPDLIKEVLAQPEDYPKFELIYDTAHVFAGEGLGTSKGPIWKSQRRLITPLFHFERLQYMLPVVIEQTEAFITEIRQKIAACPDPAHPNYKLPVTHSLGELTMAVLIPLAFGGDLDPKFIARKWKEMLAMFQIYFLGYLICGPIFTVIPSPWSSGLWKIRDEMTREICKVIAIRKKQLQSGSAPAGDLLTALLQVRDAEQGGQEIPENLVIDQALTFLFAGHDTTAALLSWALFFLTENPAVQRKIQAEVDQVLQDRKITNADLDKLVYCNAVLSETLRMRPAGLALDRQVDRDLELGGQRIVKGTVLSVGIHPAHHNTKHWSEPYTFKPERFIDTNRAAHPFAYIPFSAGPRNCVGRNFALREALPMIAMLMQSFNVEQVSDGPQDNGNMEVQVVVTPAHLKIRFTNRV